MQLLPRTALVASHTLMLLYVDALAHLITLDICVQRSVLGRKSVCLSHSYPFTLLFPWLPHPPILPHPTSLLMCSHSLDKDQPICACKALGLRKRHIRCICIIICRSCHEVFVCKCVGRNFQTWEVFCVFSVGY